MLRTPLITDPTLFPDARSAVRFATTREGRPARPLMATMTDKTAGKSELGGYDGAAQAGMILNVLDGLGGLYRSVILASAAPRTLRCSCDRACCSGRSINADWREAVGALAEAAAHQALCKTKYALRTAIIVKIYNPGASRISFMDISNDVGVDQHTVSKHYRTIHHWLMGVRGGADREPIEGVDPIAWREAESALREAGIVG